MCRKHPKDEDQKIIISIHELARSQRMLMHFCNYVWAASDVLLLLCSARAAACRRDSHSRDGHRFLRLHAGCELPALVSFSPERTLPSQQRGSERKDSVFEVPSRLSFCSYQRCRPLSALTPGNSSSPFSRRSGSWWGPSSWRRTSLKRSRVSDERNENMMKKTTRRASLLVFF